MPRFELSELNRFWEITLHGDAFVVRYGVIGEPGKQRRQQFIDDNQAQARYREAVRLMRGQGYERVPEPVKTVEVDTLSQLVLDDVDDATLAVYADALQQQGDPLGEWIAVHLALDDEAREDARQRLLSEHRALLVDVLDISPLIEVEWDCGLIRGVRLLRAQMHSPLELVRTVLTVSSARFLRRMVIDHLPDVDAVLDVLHAAGMRPSLRELAVNPAGADITWSYLGDLSGLARLYPNLRRLELHGGEIDLQDAAFPELRELVLGMTQPRSFDVFTKTSLPKLERLDLRLESRHPGAAGSAAELLEWLETTTVTHLALHDSWIADDLLRLIARSPLLKRLQSLDLRRNDVDRQGAFAISGNADAFRHVTIDLDDNFVPAGVVATLNHLDNVSLRNQDDKRIWLENRHYDGFDE